MTALAPLKTLYKKIGKKLGTDVTRYHIPQRWLSDSNEPTSEHVNPYQYWHQSIGTILDQSAEPLDHADTTNGEWSRYAVIYNLLVRSAAAYDHDGDGALGRPNADGLNETGSFTKAICLLPYIRRLGCNTIHLLPLTAIGQDGNKGDAGSPYAIRNQYKLDDNLAEPTLGVGVEDEFAAFVAAAHHLGIRVVMEFVLRTSSKDGDDIQTHPEWFYWINANVPDREPNSDDAAAYGMPIFPTEEAEQIKAEVDSGRFDNLIPPSATYRDMFLPVPRPEDVAMHDGRWIASYPDGRKGRVPGAFADWPVDDSQPPWGDVTYLRLYDHPDFNYIAYNTIRMYDTRLARLENAVQPLWDHITNIIPHYQDQFGIDGAMIDMGHALPTLLKQQVVAKARANNANFAFWDENFAAKQTSVEEGYNAVMGSIPFIFYNAPVFNNWLTQELFPTDLPIPIFGAIENHNTPRAMLRDGGATYLKFAFAVAAFLPTIPFVHGGMEFGESRPVNTGLDFSAELAAQYSSDSLPLFSAIAYKWDREDSAEIATWIRKTLELRKPYADLITDRRAETMHQIGSGHPHIAGILRRTPDWSSKIAIVYNTDMHNSQDVWMPFPTGRAQLRDRYTEQLIDMSNSWAHIQLPPGGVMWFEL